MTALAADCRDDFPTLKQWVHGRPLVYLDSAATSQKPQPVITAVERFYRHDNANVHRGIHELSNRATIAYEGARERVATFLGARDPAELIWTRGTTDATRLIASGWAMGNLSPGDEILLSVMEHHSNLVPWQMAAQRTGARLRFIGLDDQQRLDLDSLDSLLTPRVRLVAVCHVSDALGSINPVREIAARAHSVGAAVLVDGAQSAPHLRIDVEELGCDFFAFSGHKMCGPTGIGGLWGRREQLERMHPVQGGGDMIDRVDLEESTFAPLPQRFEAGTPNIAAAVGLGVAADYLEGIGMEEIRTHELELLAYAIDRLREMPGLRIYGPAEVAERSGVISFTLADIHPHDLATILDAAGVAVRAGHHCTQPLMRTLGLAATARASFYLYNTPDDVDALIDALGTARRLFRL